MSILRRLYNVARGSLMVKGKQPVRVEPDDLAPKPAAQRSEPPSEPDAPAVDITHPDDDPLERKPKKRRL